MSVSACKRAPSTSPSEQLATFIAKFEPETAKLIRACRAELRKLLPTAVELVNDNYNFFVIEAAAAAQRARHTLMSMRATGTRRPDVRG